jgi:putative tricarboxylic transport membrane protein
VIGLILGPLAEQQMRRALAISQGDFMVFLQAPISAGLLALALLVLIGPTIWKLTRRKKPGGA